MLHKIFTTYFWVTLLAVTFAAGLVWLDHFRIYQTETDILILEKTANLGAGENLAELFPTLAFYNSVLARNDALDDPFAKESPDGRKAGWHTLASLERKDASGVYTLTTYGDDEPHATLLARESVATLFDTAARFYDLKNSLDVRVVDGPYAKAIIRSVPTYLIVTVATGFGVTFLFFFVLTALDTFLSKHSRRDRQREEVKEEIHITAETFRPTRPSYWNTMGAPSTPIEEAFKEKERELVVPEDSHTRASTPGPKAKAPTNLPVLEMDNGATHPLAGAMARLIKEDVDKTQAAREQELNRLLADDALTSPALEASTPVASREPQIGEPTEEEYKRRLNELLSGKME